MTKAFKQVTQFALGVALVALAAQGAEAGTKPCPSCGSGKRPAGQVRPPSLKFPLPNGGTFTFDGNVVGNPHIGHPPAIPTGGFRLVTNRGRQPRP